MKRLVLLFAFVFLAAPAFAQECAEHRPPYLVGQELQLGEYGKVEIVRPGLIQEVSHSRFWPLNCHSLLLPVDTTVRWNDSDYVHTMTWFDIFATRLPESFLGDPRLVCEPPSADEEMEE